MRQKYSLLENNRVRRNTYRFRWSDKIDVVRPLLKPMANALVYAAGLAMLSWGMIYCHDFLIQYDYFNAAAIYVNGHKQLSRKQIIELARIHESVNILSVNTRVVEQRLKSNPWIDEAKVHREYPFAIRIDIREHTPLAIMDMGRKFLIDERGDIFKEWETNDPYQLPIISGLDYTDIRVKSGEQTQYYQAAMEILEFGKVTDSILPNRLIRRIHIDKDIGAVIYPSYGVRTLKLGFQDYAEKFDYLRNILNTFNVTLTSTPTQDGMAIDSIDLHNPNRIVMTPAQTESVGGENKEV